MVLEMCVRARAAWKNALVEVQYGRGGRAPKYIGVLRSAPITAHRSLTKCLKTHQALTACHCSEAARLHQAVTLRHRRWPLQLVAF